MAYPKLKIADDDGNVADVTSNRLDVNAYLSATPTIDIGDVSLLLGGTAASVNNGAADATTLRVTVASNSTGVISVDDNGGALTVDNAGTFAVQSTLQANSGVDIGDVDVTSIIPGAGALNLGKQEDAAHSTGDVGVMALAVRTASPADMSNADGDYEPLQMDEGRVWASTLVTKNVNPDGMSSIDSLARVTVPTTNEAISVTTSTTETAAKEIIIQASDSNDQDIHVGDSGAQHATNGIVVAPGDTLILPIADLSSVYWDTSASGTQRAFVTIIK